MIVSRLLVLSRKRTVADGDGRSAPQLMLATRDFDLGGLDCSRVTSRKEESRSVSRRHERRMNRLDEESFDFRIELV